ncbi:hypothetical protein AWB71_05299 [Caballeronia peredens]|nr:hypothetical protein AWB71_05299 [Caballeronia peredens]
MKLNNTYTNKKLIKNAEKESAKKQSKTSPLLAKMMGATSPKEPSAQVVYETRLAADGTVVTTARPVSDLPPEVAALLSRSKGKNAAFYAGLKEVIANIEDEA